MIMEELVAKYKSHRLLILTILYYILKSKAYARQKSIRPNNGRQFLATCHSPEHPVNELFVCVDAVA